MIYRHCSSLQAAEVGLRGVPGGSGRQPQMSGLQLSDLLPRLHQDQRQRRRAGTPVEVAPQLRVPIAHKDRIPGCGR